MRYSKEIKWKRATHLFDRKNIEVRERLGEAVEEIWREKKYVLR